MTSLCFVNATPVSLRSRSVLSPARCASAPVQPTALLPFFRGGPRLPSLPSFRLPRFRFGFGSGAGAFGGGAGFSGGSGGRRGRTDGLSAGGGPGSSGKNNIFVSLWAMYNARLAVYPITTKAITSLIGFFLGDLVAQKFLGDEGAAFNWARIARMSAFGFLIHGPAGHYFYSFLDRLIVGTSPLKVASKVAIDQILWAPVFTALFFSFLGFAEGKSLDDVIEKIKRDTWIAVTTSWKFWPLAHTINFAFVPTSQRLLYINSLQIGYNVILSMLGNK